MSSRTLIYLVVALGIIGALALAVSLSQRSASRDGDLFLPNLRARINDIDRIVVKTGGSKTVATLERKEDGWLLAEREGYPADVGKIRQNLIALSEARMLEEKTSNPEFYERLQVQDIDKENAGGVQLDLGAGNETTSVIIGNTGVGGGARAYARRAGEATSWLISGSFQAPRETNEWLDQRLTDIDAARVHAVAITHPDGTSLRIEKSSPDAPDFTVLNVPKGRALSFPGVGNATAAALDDLSLQNAAPAGAFAPGDVKPTLARYETFDGLVVEVSTFKLPSGIRVRFGASVDAALAGKFAPKPAEATKAEAAAKPAETGPAADKELESTQAPERKTIDEVQAEAAQLNARLGNWVYTLADFDAEQFTKKMSDMLEPLPPGK